LFGVLCKCNLFGFYITFIVQWVFSFPSFHLLFILFYLLLWKWFVMGVLHILFLKFWKIFYL
jgi:hypothetical protein